MCRYYRKRFFFCKKDESSWWFSIQALNVNVRRNAALLFKIARFLNWHFHMLNPLDSTLAISAWFRFQIQINLVFVVDARREVLSCHPGNLGFIFKASFQLLLFHSLCWTICIPEQISVNHLFVPMSKQYSDQKRCQLIFHDFSYFFMRLKPRNCMFCISKLA